MRSAPGNEQSLAGFDVELVGVSKAFGATAAVHDLTLRVEQGVFFSLLGPSGCGKTTTLRLIAGFEQPTTGQILIRGEDVAGLPPYRRDVNTVFQSYALFPHMSVADNIAYGLRQKHLSRAEIKRKVGEALDMVRLPAMGDRRPAALSGGQQQRVALARALVNRPTVLLLDEPLSALDLKLRKEMQLELKALQHAVGITFIYVTHDQEEAITLSNRIGVMNAGRIEQEGTPTDVYERPRTRFVADFIGLTNFLEGTVQEVTADTVLVETAFGLIACGGPRTAVVCGERVTLTLRPEKVRLLPDDTQPSDGWNAAAGVVTQAAFLGAQNEYHIRIGNDPSGGPEMVVRQQNSGTVAGDEAVDSHFAGLNDGWRVFGPGERVMLTWHRDASLILREPDRSAPSDESAKTLAPASRASLV